MGIKMCVIQGAGSFWGPKRGYNRGNCGYLKNIPLTNQRFNCHWYLVWSITLGQGYSRSCK